MSCRTRKLFLHFCPSLINHTLREVNIFNKRENPYFMFELQKKVFLPYFGANTHGAYVTIIFIITKLFMNTTQHRVKFRQKERPKNHKASS